MKIKLALASTLLLITACKSTPEHASDIEVTYYFNNQIIKAYSGEVKHPKYGILPATEEPYATDFAKCQADVYAGHSFLFGSIKVDDPVKLEQWSNDHVARDLDFLFSKKKDVTPKPIFDDKRFKANLKSINKLSSKTLDCVKNKGWVFVSNNNSAAK